MNTKNIYKFLTILLGYVLIIGGFIIFGDSLENKVKILDIVVSCFIFTQFVLFTIFPLINLGTSAHKEVGMMGIHFFVLNLCCVLSIGIMVYGIIHQVPFKYQMMTQLVVLFLLFVGRFATLRSGEKVLQIYQKEQMIMEGKNNLKALMDDFSDDIATVKDLDPIAKEKLSSIYDAMRFITPSANPEAKKIDHQFIQTIGDLKVLMRNVTINKEKIIEEREHLERILSRRKKY